MRSWSSPDREEGLIEQGASEAGKPVGRREFFDTEGRRWGKGAPRTEDTEKIEGSGASRQSWCGRGG